jgi:ABC-type antimicrobial peptide transport system permease subunit
MRSALFGVTSHDPSTFILTTALMVLMVLAGCVVPAIRAARIDPAILLRAE